MRSPGLALALSCLRDSGLAYAREDSVKLLPGVVLDARTMLGVHASDLDDERLHGIVSRLGMPPDVRDALMISRREASVVLFGVEDGPDGCTFKVYLEFWDRVQAEVRRTGSRQPLLLHLAYKWRAGAKSGRVGRYTCFPMLTRREIATRLRATFPPDSETGSADIAVSLLEQCAARRPTASFVYLEAVEEGSPRQSFDLNLYKSGLDLEGVGEWLARAGACFGAGPDFAGGLLRQAGGCALGHISGGVDRAGREFLTLYFEREPLPARRSTETDGR